MNIIVRLSIFSFFILFSSTLCAQSEVKPDSIVQAVIDVEYLPVDSSGINWKSELEIARVIPTLDGKGIRITLPNADPAKVIILDKKGKKKLKMLNYVAPAVIDISDLKYTEYQLILQSHNVVSVKTFERKRMKRN